MTLNEIASQLEMLSIKNLFNHEIRPKGWIKMCLDTHFIRGESDRPFTAEIAMRDRFWWLVKVYKVPNVPNCYDYYIPETREENEALWKSLWDN
jgi:hypothetical protein